MKSYEAPGISKIHVLRIDSGEDLLESIEQFIREKGIQEGAVVSGVATLDYAVIHMVTTTGYPAVEYFKRWENAPLEMISLNGVIADYKPHLHITLSDCEMAYGGHLEKGCRILYLCEVVVLEFACAEALVRKPNAQNINTLI